MTSNTDRKVRCSLLENGASVISKDNGGNSARLTFMYKDGPVFENVFNAGSSQFMKYALSKDSVTSSEYVSKIQLQKAGVLVEAPELINKTWLGFSCGGVRDTLTQAEVCEKFWQMLLFPRFTDAAIKESKRLIKLENEEVRREQPYTYLMDVLHKTAFKGSPLGHSLYCPGYNLNTINSDALFNRWDSLYGFKNIAVVATNVNHDELLHALTDTPWLERAHASTAGVQVPESTYVGGEAYDVQHRNVDYDDQFFAVYDTFTALAFKAPGLATIEEWAAAQIIKCSLQTATSSVMKSSFTINHVDVFYQAYGTTGLLGMTTPSATAKQLSEFKKAVTTFATMNETALQAHKTGTALSILAGGDSVQGVHELLLNTFAASGEPMDVAELAAVVQQVTPATMKKVVDSMLAAQPTLVHYGNSPAAPTLADLK